MNAKDALSRKISAQLTLLHLIERALHDRTGYWTLQVLADRCQHTHVYPMNVLVPDEGVAEIIFQAYDLGSFGPSSVAICLNGETLLSMRADITGGDLEMGYSLESAPAL